MEPNGTPEVTDVKEWKKKGQGVPLEMPSGNVALVRPVGMQVFLERGLIPNSLRSMILDAIKHDKLVELNAEKIDEQQFEDMLSLFNSVTVYCVVEPKVFSVPMRPVDIPGGALSGVTEVVPLDERDENKLYADEVDFEDKAFIFQFAVGGTRNLDKFREEFAINVSGLSGGKNLEGASKSTDGDK